MIFDEQHIVLIGIARHLSKLGTIAPPGSPSFHMTRWVLPNNWYDQICVVSNQAIPVNRLQNQLVILSAVLLRADTGINQPFQVAGIIMCSKVWNYTCEAGLSLLSKLEASSNLPELATSMFSNNEYLNNNQ